MTEMVARERTATFAHVFQNHIASASGVQTVVLKGDPNNTHTGEVRERCLGHKIAKDFSFRLEFAVSAMLSCAL
jgi:hypothetical protein